MGGRMKARKIDERPHAAYKKSWTAPGSIQVYLNQSFTTPDSQIVPSAGWGSNVKVMADVGKYIEHIEDEEKRSHPFGVTNVLLNGLNGRKNKTTLDSGRALTWICFFGMVIGVCGAVIYLSARAAEQAKLENCQNLTELYPGYCDKYICCKDDPSVTTLPESASSNIDSEHQENKLIQP